MGTDLKTALHDIIDNHNVRSYDDFKLAARVLDQDPENSSNLILIYSGESFPAGYFGTGGEVWNREHLWPQSYGVDGDDYNTVGYSDFHHLFPALADVNTVRLNRYYDWTDPDNRYTHPRAPGSSYDDNSWEPRDEDKGRVARAILYMATRYEGLNDEKRTSSTSLETPDLKLSDRANSGSETMGKLSVLLEWNRMYSPDEREQRRNQGIYEGVQWGTRIYQQGNRNPFVDHPEYADAIYRATSFVSYGTWRITYFSELELRDESVSGDLEDPDGDRLPNLIELGCNWNPRLADAGFPMTEIKNGDGTVTLSYLQLGQPEISGLSYAIQYSTDPWNEASWASVPGSPDLTNIDGWTYEASLTDTPDSLDDTFYRLHLSRAYPLDNPGEAVFDPARHSAPEGSIFAYDGDPQDGWQLPDWLSPTHTSNYPWVYQHTHLWIRFHAVSPASVWIYDEHLGWFWTRESIYPIVWSAVKNEWIRFDSGHSEPNRQLTFLESGIRISEEQF